jgi:hypothetical protein
MAVLDINEGFDSVGKKISTNKKYKKIKEDVDNLKKKKGSTFEEKTSNLSKQLSEAKKIKKNIKRKKNPS